MILKIVSTPTSITITDSIDNRLVVVKTKSGIEFHSQIDSHKTSQKILDLQKEIKRIILNPNNNRDNYRVRFDRLAKELTEVKTHSFITLKHKLQVK